LCAKRFAIKARSTPQPAVERFTGRVAKEAGLVGVLRQADEILQIDAPAGGKTAEKQPKTVGICQALR
jgi:hypothetical protein